MSVELTPNNALGFHRPLTSTVKRTLTVSNPNDAPIVFKVKTTAPKQYCVRPNSGRVEPGERVEVQVLLQPFKEDPPASTKCKDKFLVQSAIVAGDHLNLSLQDMWSALEKENKAAIHEQKIRCAFLPPVDAYGGEGESTTVNGSSFLSADNAGLHDSTFTNAESTSSDIKDPRYGSVRSSTNGDAFSTPARQSVVPSTYIDSEQAPSISLPSTSQSPLAPQNSTFESTSSQSDAKPIAQIVSEAPNKPVVETLKEAGASIVATGAAVGTTIQETASTGLAKTGLTNGLSTSTLSSPREDDSAVVSALRKQLTVAEAEITRLKTLSKDNSGGLRQRNVGSTTSSTSATASLPSQTQVDGVPVQIVAGLCFGIFVFTWLFF